VVHLPEHVVPGVSCSIAESGLGVLNVLAVLREVSTRWDLDEAFEGAGEVAMVGETGLRRDASNGRAPGEELPGAADAYGDLIPVRGEPHLTAERPATSEAAPLSRSGLTYINL
jgi:hypothetical protein